MAAAEQDHPIMAGSDDATDAEKREGIRRRVEHDLGGDSAEAREERAAWETESRVEAEDDGSAVADGSAESDETAG